MTGAATWRLLDHTADTGFEVTADSPRAVLETAASVLMGLLAAPDGIEPRATRHLEVRGRDAAELLVRWLAEILSLHDAERLVFCRFAVAHLDEEHLTATLSGEPYDPARHTLKGEIKAVTYHQAFFGRDGALWKGRVILDV